jgi:AAA+ ATPase superfamily predicted ATPase
MNYLIYKDNAFFNPKTKEKLCETKREANKFLLKHKIKQKKLSITPKKSLNYLVCKNCGELSNIKQELKAIEKHGSQGMCMCCYESGNRVFLPFYRIDKNLYLVLQLYSKKDRVSLVEDLELIEW